VVEAAAADSAASAEGGADAAPAEDTSTPVEGGSES